VNEVKKDDANGEVYKFDSHPLYILFPTIINNIPIIPLFGNDFYNILEKYL
jgi:hypothetical protein